MSYKFLFIFRSKITFRWCFYNTIMGSVVSSGCDKVDYALLQQYDWGLMQRNRGNERCSKCYPKLWPKAFGVLTKVCQGSSQG